jgi:ABC-type oligopeptide transport system substrate-binding subunit
VVLKKSVPLHRFNKAINCLTQKNLSKMKKLVFMFVACATMSLAVSFSSCGNGAAADSTDTTDTTVVADSADTTVADTAAADTAAADTANA